METDNNLAIDIATKKVSEPELLSANAEIYKTSHLDSSTITDDSISSEYLPDDSYGLFNHSTSQTTSNVSRINHDSGQPRSKAAIDFFVVLTSFVAMHYVFVGNLDLSSFKTITLYGTTALLMAVLSISGLYNTKKLHNLNGELINLSICWITTFATVSICLYLGKAGLLSKIWVNTSLILILASLTAIRVFDLVNLATNGKVKTINIIVCGENENISSVMSNLLSKPNSNFQVSNIFGFSNRNSSKSHLFVSPQHHVKRIVNYIEQQRITGDFVDQVWIAVPKHQSEIVDIISETLNDSTVDICVVPDSYTERLLNGESTIVGGNRIVNISDISLSPAADQFKRVFDIVLASFAALILSIPMAVIAILVKIESSGPAIFRQKRYGVDGKEIEVLKFRSMHVHTDAVVTQATRDDARVTRIGRVLRSSSLDELPQLFNVLLGHMSIIGPRPHASAHNEVWRNKIDGYMLRHKVRPGITGLAQVSGYRGETNTDHKMEQRVKYDLEYIKNWSPWLDIKIVFMTVVSLIRDKDVY